MSHIDYKTHFKRIFSGLSEEDHSKFFEYLDENVVFYNNGQHPWSGVIDGVNEVREHGFEGINNYLQAPIRYKLVQLSVEGNCCYAILDGTAKQRNGKPYNNRYCFYAEMNKKSMRMTKLEAFYDTQAVQDLVRENPPELKMKNA